MSVPPPQHHEDSARLVHSTIVADAFENLEAAVLVGDDDLNYVACNRAAEELLRLPRTEIVGRRTGSFAPEGYGERQRDRVVANGAAFGEVTLQRGDGTTTHVAWRAFRSRVLGIGGFYVSLLWPVELDPASGLPDQ